MMEADLNDKTMQLAAELKNKPLHSYSVRFGLEDTVLILSQISSDTVVEGCTSEVFHNVISDILDCFGSAVTFILQTV